VTPKIPDQRCVIRGARPTSSPANASSRSWTLFLERAVAEAAEHEPEILCLLPVVVAVACVVRAGEVLGVQRFRGDDLPARGLHRLVERFEEAALRVPVCRNHDLVGVELVERPHRVALADLRTRFRGLNRQPPNPAGRVNRPVRRVEDRAVVATGEPSVDRRAPLDREAVVLKRFVLRSQGLRLLGIGGEAEAARSPEGVTCERAQSRERALGQVPQASGILRAELSARGVVRRRAAA